MKQVIFSNWNFMRFVRLGLGIFITVQSVMLKDWTMSFLGAMFTIMPILNIGCCGVGGCATIPVKKTDETTKEITYEEVV